MSRRRRQHQGAALAGHRRQTAEDRAAVDALQAADGCSRCERRGVPLLAVPVTGGFQVRCTNQVACAAAIRAAQVAELAEEEGS